jgi:DNA-binding transcriptional LysR family regulator
MLVLEDPMLLAVPADHSLAARRLMSPRDVDRQPWITRPRALNPAAEDKLLQVCLASGFKPDLRLEAAGPATSLAWLPPGRPRLCSGEHALGCSIL